MKKIKNTITLIILGGVAVLSIALMNGWRLDDYTIPKTEQENSMILKALLNRCLSFRTREKGFYWIKTFLYK